MDDRMTNLVFHSEGRTWVECKITAVEIFQSKTDRNKIGCEEGDWIHLAVSCKHSNKPSPLQQGVSLLAG
jgi:hypothetical protein